MANLDASEKFALSVTRFPHQRTIVVPQRNGAGSVLGVLLKQWRKSQGLTLEALAEAIGTSKGHLSDMERNNKPLSSRWLEKIADTYKISASDIIGNTTSTFVGGEPGEAGVRQKVLDQFETLTPEAQADILAVMKHMPKRP